MIIIRINLKHVDYDSIAERFLPDLFKNVTEESKLSMKVANELLVKNKITNNIAKGILKIIPQSAKDKFAVDLLKENKNLIIISLNKRLKDNQIDIRIISFKIAEIHQGESGGIKVEIILEEINYNTLLKSILPKILMLISKKDEKHRNLVKVLMEMKELPVEMMSAALAVLTQEEKDEMLAKLFGIYQEDIVDMINQKVAEQQISVVISDIGVKAKIE